MRPATLPKSSKVNTVTNTATLPPSRTPPSTPTLENHLFRNITTNLDGVDWGNLVIPPPSDYLSDSPPPQLPTTPKPQLSDLDDDVTYEAPPPVHKGSNKQVRFSNSSQLPRHNSGGNEVKFTKTIRGGIFLGFCV